MERHPQYLDRIDRLKEKVFETYPEIDLEDAKLLTQSFLETQGEALVTRKAKPSAAGAKSPPATNGSSKTA